MTFQVPMSSHLNCARTHSLSLFPTLCFSLSFSLRFSLRCRHFSQTLFNASSLWKAMRMMWRNKRLGFKSNEILTIIQKWVGVTATKTQQDISDKSTHTHKSTSKIETEIDSITVTTKKDRKYEIKIRYLLLFACAPCVCLWVHSWLKLLKTKKKVNKWKANHSQNGDIVCTLYTFNNTFNLYKIFRIIF